MIDRWLEAHRLHASGMDAQRGEGRYGIVTSIDPTRAAVKVNYQPSGAGSGWLQVLSPWVGAGWGLMHIPSIGSQVLLMPVEGDAEQCVVLGSTYNDQDTPPGGYTADEHWLVHKSGSFIKLANDGTIQIKGDVHVDGDIYDKHGSLDRLRGNYNAHLHTGVLTGGGETATTTKTDPE